MRKNQPSPISQEPKSTYNYNDNDFLLDSNGLWKIKKKNSKVTKEKISDPIAVIARLSNYETSTPLNVPNPDLQLLISFETQDKKTVIKPFARSLISQSSSFMGDLAGYGFYVNVSYRKFLIEFLNRQNPKLSMHYVVKPGWTSRLDAFVFPDKTISWNNDSVENLKLLNYNKKFCIKGAIEDWQKHVVKSCIDHPLFAFALATAFTPPLLRLVNMDSFCINFYGESSKGKTTALQVASSVWGCGSEPSRVDSYIYNWNSTGNALNYLAAGSNDVLLAVDELGSFRNESLGQVVYALSGGKSRKGMSSDNKAREDLTWNMVLLSTSEISGRQKMEEYGRVYTGQLNRFIDIPANTVNELESAKSFNAAKIDAIKQYCSEFYGSAGLILIDLITQFSSDKENLIKQVGHFHQELYKELLNIAHVKSIQITSEIQRSISRFALIFAAARFVTHSNILGLSENPDDMLENAKIYEKLKKPLQDVFNVWLDNLNLEPRSIKDRMMASIRNYIFVNQSKFIEVTAPVQNATVKLPSSIIGYHYQDQAQNLDLFLLTDDTFAKACQGFSVTESAKELDISGLLHRNDQERYKSYMTVPSMGGTTDKIRFYAIKADILIED